MEDRERRESVASHDYPRRNLSDEDLAWIRGENQDGQTSSLPDGRTSDERVSQNDWARQQYDDYVAVQYDRAMIATNGQMVNERGRLAGVDSYSLFSGPVARVKKYGSEELQGFFGQNGRHTFASFHYSLFTWRSDYTAHENAKNEDFGDVPHVTQHTWCAHPPRAPGGEGGQLSGYLGGVIPVAEPRPPRGPGAAVGVAPRLQPPQNRSGHRQLRGWGTRCVPAVAKGWPTQWCGGQPQLSGEG